MTTAARADGNQDRIVGANQMAASDRHAGRGQRPPAPIVRPRMRKHDQEDREAEPPGLDRIGHDDGGEKHVAGVGGVEERREQTEAASKQHRRRAGQGDDGQQRAEERPEAERDLGFPEQRDRDRHGRVGPDVQPVDVVSGVIVPERDGDGVGDVSGRVLGVVAVPVEDAETEPQEADRQQRDARDPVAQVQLSRMWIRSTKLGTRPGSDVVDLERFRDRAPRVHIDREGARRGGGGLTARRRAGKRHIEQHTWLQEGRRHIDRRLRADDAPVVVV